MLIGPISFGGRSVDESGNYFKTFYKQGPWANDQPIVNGADAMLAGSFGSLSSLALPTLDNLAPH